MLAAADWPLLRATTIKRGMAKFTGAASQQYTLVQIRKLGPAVQINIADKQINTLPGSELADSDQAQLD